MFIRRSRLVAVTPEAERSLGGKKQIDIAEYPFRIGRESRQSNSPAGEFVELRIGILPELNEVYLVEPHWTDLLQISREHMQVEEANGKFFVADRGSQTGTIVAGRSIGGNRNVGRAEVKHGDEVVIGNEHSAYVFRFEVVG